MITALELRTGGTAAPALPPLRPSSPHSRHPPNQSPSSPGPMVAPAPRDTEDTRGRREPHIPAHTHPPPISTPRRFPPLPVPGRRGPAAAARKPRGAPGRRWRPGGGAGAATLERSGHGERRGRRGEGRDGEILWFTAVFLGSRRERGEGGGPAGCARGRESPEGLKSQPERSAEGVRRQGLGRVFPDWVGFVG